MVRARLAISSPCSVSSMPDFRRSTRLTQLVLQLLDLHAERRLADGAGFRRMAEIAGFGQGLQVAQLPQRNHGDKDRLCFL
jgi:hypothetical protein